MRSKRRRHLAYVIKEIQVTDPATMRKYGEKMPETLAPFNHHYLVRGGKPQALESEGPKSDDRFRQRRESARVVQLAGLPGDQADQAKRSEDPQIYRRRRRQPVTEPINLNVFV